MRPLAFVLLLVAIGCLAASADELQQARQLIAKKSYTEAEAILREAVKNPAQAPEANYLWYQSLRDRGELERGLEKLQEAADLAANRADWYVELGAALTKLNRSDEAMLQYVRALAIQPSYAAAHSALAGVFVSKGMTAQAEEQYREALKTADTEADWVALCELLLRTGRVIPAMQAAQAGLAKLPKSVPLLRTLGRIYEQAGETTRALEAYTNLAKLKPNDAAVHLDLGRLNRAKGESQKALVEYQKAARLAPRDPAGFIGMALVQCEQPGRAPAALALADRALKLAPNSLDAMAAKGWVLHQLKRDGDAVEVLTAAATRQPGSVDAMLYLGLIANSRGERPEAEKWLRQAAAEGAGTEAGKRAQAALAEIGATGAAPASGTPAVIAPSVAPGAEK